MLTYLFFFLLSILFSMLCYATNGIVVLFCNEEGELPGFLKYWQTWDDCCNPSDIKNFVPKIFLFDWDKHYEEYRDTTPELLELGRDRSFCRVIDPNFTIKERIQRYFCRLLWLTRNCSYGFCFWLLGKTIREDSLEIVKQLDDEHGKLTYVRSVGKSIWTAPFLYKNDRDIIPGVIRWCNFFGWKIDYKTNMMHRAMIAGRLAVRFGKR